MAFPAGWPPRQSSGIRTGRFYKTGTSTANYNENAWLVSADEANTTVTTATATPMVIPSNPTGGGNTTLSLDNTVTGAQFWLSNWKIVNKDNTNTLFFSFDGTNDHGQVAPNTTLIYRDRYESGISVKGTSISFVIEAW